MQSEFKRALHEQCAVNVLTSSSCVTILVTFKSFGLHKLTVKVHSVGRFEWLLSELSFEPSVRTADTWICATLKDVVGCEMRKKVRRKEHTDELSANNSLYVTQTETSVNLDYSNLSHFWECIFLLWCIEDKEKMEVEETGETRTSWYDTLTLIVLFLPLAATYCILIL